MKVLLCAPSGKAAFLINGVTLHSAFALPVKQYGVNVSELSSDVANTVREKLSDVQLIVIDEISMVGSKLFSVVDTRLRQIKGVNKPFGGVSILTVGDLNQLPPVGDKPVYEVSRQNEMAAFMNVNPLWAEFEFYELTEVMRQQDDLPFIHALNNLALGKLSHDDIQLFKSREIDNENDVPATAIRLYATNVNVFSYNMKKIAECPNELVISYAEDSFSKEISVQMKKIMLQSLQRKKKESSNDLLDKLELKIDIKYMVISNIDVEDGLVNGACGLLKLITFKENTKIPSTLWIDFQVSRVGIKARQRFHEFMKKNNIDPTLTPITKVCLLVNINNDNTYQITRNQFPVVPAEAITIHKSQGQTYNEICLDFRKKERRSLQMLYVALSRVTKLSGLYILGVFQIAQLQEGRKTTSPIFKELTRLRTTKQLQLTYNNLMNGNGLKIVYQNVGTLKNKLTHIVSDQWFLRNNILIFSETMTTANDQLNIEQYKIVYRSDRNKEGRGLVCYVRNNLCVENILVERQFNDKGSMEVLVLNIKGYYIISGYKSPQASKILFENVVKTVMDKLSVESKKIFLGDFNYNVFKYRENESNYLINYLNQYEMSTKLPDDNVTTNLNTQIDVIFANIDNIDCGVYETYFSYHKPIYIIIDIQFSDQVNANTAEVNNIDNNFDILRLDNKFETMSSCQTISSANSYECPPQDAHVNHNYNFTISAKECQDVILLDFCLQDTHINVFHEIMNTALNERGIYNFAQNTGYVQAFLQNIYEIPSDSSNIQIIYSGVVRKNAPVGHWICTKYDGQGNIHIYDSMNYYSLHSDQIAYMNALYKFPTQYIFHKVQNQRNSYDCGVLAIYFATLLYYGEDPSRQNYYDIAIMRRHICSMLLQRKLQQFPVYT